MAEVSEKDLAELRRKISVLEQDVQHLVSHDHSQEGDAMILLHTVRM